MGRAGLGSLCPAGTWAESPRVPLLLSSPCPRLAWVPRRDVPHPPRDAVSPPGHHQNLSGAKHSAPFIEERGEEGILPTCKSRDGDIPAPGSPLQGSHAPPALGGSGEEQGSEDAGQQEVAASEAGGWPGGSGGAVAEVSVAAVDADPRQLLLLAVTGGGTAAGQQDAQDHCKASTGRDVRDRGVTARMGGDALPALHRGQAPFEGCKVCFGV